MSTRPGGAGRWPEHLPVGAVRVGRSSIHYDETIRFYRDLVGLPVLESFAGSYGKDGTIFGLPDPAVQLELVRSAAPAVGSIDSICWCSTCPTRRPSSAWSRGWRCRCGADITASLLARERRRDLPGSGRAPGGVRVVGLRARPDLTAPYPPDRQQRGHAFCSRGIRLTTGPSAAGSERGSWAWSAPWWPVSMGVAGPGVPSSYLRSSRV
jgi:hypothetical protein